MLSAQEDARLWAGRKGEFWDGNLTQVPVAQEEMTAVVVSFVDKTSCPIATRGRERLIWLILPGHGPLLREVRARI